MLKYDGYTYEQIDKLDVCLSAVKSCIQKFLNVGINAALNDWKGCGRKPEISDSDITWVINRACERLKVRGYAARTLASGQFYPVYPFHSSRGRASAYGNCFLKHFA